MPSPVSFPAPLGAEACQKAAAFCPVISHRRQTRSEVLLPFFRRKRFAAVSPRNDNPWPNQPLNLFGNTGGRFFCVLFSHTHGSVHTAKTVPTVCDSARFLSFCQHKRTVPLCSNGCQENRPPDTASPRRQLISHLNGCQENRPPDTNTNSPIGVLTFNS